MFNNNYSRVGEAKVSRPDLEIALDLTPDDTMIFPEPSGLATANNNSEVMFTAVGRLKEYLEASPNNQAAYSVFIYELQTAAINDIHLQQAQLTTNSDTLQASLASQAQGVKSGFTVHFSSKQLSVVQSFPGGNILWLLPLSNKNDDSVEKTNSGTIIVRPPE